MNYGANVLGESRRISKTGIHLPILVKKIRSMYFFNNVATRYSTDFAPTYRQCFSTLRLRAIFSPTSVHTGLVSTIFPKSAFTALTLPPVDKDPMFTIRTSFFDNFCT